MGTPKTKRGASIIKRHQHELGARGVLWLLPQSTRKEGSFGLYIHEDVLTLAFKRIGREGSSALMLNGLALKPYEKQLQSS